MDGDLDPAALLAACRDADAGRRRDAYRRLGVLLVRIARSRLRGGPELAPLAEECAQEALVAIWQKVEAEQGPDAPERFIGWCAAITVHKVYDALRRQGYVSGSGGQSGDPSGRQTSEQPGNQSSGRMAGHGKRIPPALLASLEALAGEGDSPTSAESWLPDPEALHPEAEALRRAAFARLLLAVRDHPKLSDHSRAILARGFLAEATDAELAAGLGISRPNVQVIRSRNLGKLREDAAFVAELRGWYGDGEAGRE